MRSAALVSSLLASRSPSAILWRVVPVVVDAIKRQTGRTLPHVGKEILEFQPSLTHRDTSPAVIIELTDIRVPATPQHCSPNPVFGSVTTIVRREPVCGEALLHHLRIETAAAFGQAAAQVGDWKDALLTACAATKPERISAIGSASFDQCQPSEHFTRDREIAHVSL